MSGALCSASSTAFVQGVTIRQITHGLKLLGKTERKRDRQPGHTNLISLAKPS